MRFINAFIVLLISSLAITGISYIDDQIWNVIFLVAGMVSYSIVGFLFSIGALRGKESGKEAYGYVFFLLILGGFFVYQKLVEFKDWVLEWPIGVKIAVPSVIALTIIALFVIRHHLRKAKEKNENPKDELQTKKEDND